MSHSWSLPRDGAASGFIALIASSPLSPLASPGLSGHSWRLFLRIRRSLHRHQKKALQPSPQALHHFTQVDQVNQLVGASEADLDLGFIARLLALCSLPRTNPGNRHQYKRVNGPYKLILSRTGEYKLPYGNLPRLLLAWVCTEAVRTQSSELVLGDSLAEFMRSWMSSAAALTLSR